MQWNTAQDFFVQIRPIEKPNSQTEHGLQTQKNMIQMNEWNEMNEWASNTTGILVLR